MRLAPRSWPCPRQKNTPQLCRTLGRKARVRMAKSEPIATVRVYPAARSDLYAEVRVWRTLRDMRRYAAGRPGRLRSALGQCCGTEAYRVIRKQRRKTGQFATVDLAKNYLGPRIVAHEMTHAALRYRDRAGFQLDFTPDRNCGEERLCYAVGDMCSQLWRKLRRRGVCD